MSPLLRWMNLLRHFVLRDIRQRYLVSFSGALWALLQPALLLAIYALVFVHVLRARLPDEAGGDFLPYLALGLWPWTAFSEAVVRGVGSIPEHAGLLAKVAVPREVLVLAPVASSFLVHGIGWLAIAVLLALDERAIALGGIPFALLAYVLLFAFAAGLALALASINVFLRDLAHALPQLVVLWFFLTPIFYAPSMVPAAMRSALEFNPMNAFIVGARDPLLGLALGPAPWIAALAATVALALGVLVFRRLGRHFEDFL